MRATIAPHPIIATATTPCDLFERED